MMTAVTDNVNSNGPHKTVLRCVMIVVWERNTGPCATSAVRVGECEVSPAVGNEKWRYDSWLAVWWRPVCWCRRQPPQPDWRTPAPLRDQVRNAKLSFHVSRARGRRDRYTWSDCSRRRPVWSMRHVDRDWWRCISDRWPLYTQHLIHLSTIWRSPSTPA